MNKQRIRKLLIRGLLLLAYIEVYVRRFTSINNKRHARAQKLSCPCIVLRPMGGLCNALSAIQGAIIAGALLNKKVYVQWDDTPFHFGTVGWHELFEPPKAFEVWPYTSDIRPSAHNLIQHFTGIKYCFKLLSLPVKLALSLMPSSNLRQSILRKINRALHINRVFIAKYPLDGFSYDARISGFAPFRVSPYVPEKIIPMDFSIYKDKQRIFFTYFRNIFDLNYDKPLPPELGNYDFFKPIPAIQKQIDLIVQSFNKHTIGVHIRRTDQVLSIRYSPTPVFIKEMQQAIVSNPDTLFYVASDDLEEVKNLQSIFGEKIITQASTHFDRQTEEGMQSAVVDLFCLSKTQRIIGSFRSTFSDVAAKMGGIEWEALIVSRGTD